MKFIHGKDRKQLALFPTCLDDSLVDADNEAGKDFREFQSYGTVKLQKPDFTEVFPIQQDLVLYLMNNQAIGWFLDELPLAPIPHIKKLD